MPKGTLLVAKGTSLRATKLQGPYVLRETYEEVLLDNGMLLIDDKAIFANDTLMVEHDQAHEISICDAQKKELVTLRTQAPLFAVWSPEGKRAPFICIEPWYGNHTKKYVNASNIQKFVDEALVK